MKYAGATTGACLVAVLVLAAPSAGAQSTYRENGQQVAMRVTDSQGTLVTVCLEAGPEVAGKKWAAVDFGGPPATLSASRENGGPDCVSFSAEGEDFSVRLQYTRFIVSTASLRTRIFPRAEFRGRTLTFRWVRD